jgi:hypothetical protein
MLPIDGRWEINVDNNVVMLWFADSWNEEATISFIKEFKTKTQPLIHKQWAIISVFEQWQLGIPAIEKHVIKLSDWFIANGCVKDCHVYSPNFFKRMQLERMIPEIKDTYERRVFADAEHGIEWLAKEGFEISNPQFIYDKFNGCSMHE